MDEGLRDRRDRSADALAGESARVSEVVTFIETGTGRRGLNYDEGAILAERASSFPLLA